MLQRYLYQAVIMKLETILEIGFAVSDELVTLDTAIRFGK